MLWLRRTVCSVEQILERKLQDFHGREVGEGSVLFLLARQEWEGMQEHWVFSVSSGFDECMVRDKAGGEKTPEKPR